VSEVHSVLTARYTGAANSQATRTAMASVGGDIIQPSIAVASAAPAAPPIDNAAYLSTFPDVHAAAPVTMASASTTTAGNAPPPSDPIFRSLFQAPGEPAQPISPKVRELWGNSSSLTSVASVDPAPAASPASARTPEIRAPQPLDLFSDRNGTFS
jgi:hypothetical protein